jgi:transglutaminase-like putative cysteine protease
MRLKVNHSTHYRYEAPVSYSLLQVRLTPKSRDTQVVHEWDMQIKGGRKELEFTDQHDNLVVLISIDPGQQELSITSSGTVETFNTHGVKQDQAGYAPLWYFQKTTELTKPGQGIKALVKGMPQDFSTEVAKLHGLAALIAKDVVYQSGATDSFTSAENALSSGKGVCQDHSHIFIAATRMMGYPARYVSGYLMMNDRVEQEAGHAWAEVRVDGLGWVGFDVSNGISPDERYIRIATGLDYRDAAPISGIRHGQGGESMTVTVHVQQQ